jgi:hypothetical protein
MITYILAVVFYADMQNRAPMPVGPFKSQDACFSEALKRNKTDPQLQRNDLRELGAEYVCLKIERSGV